MEKKIKLLELMDELNSFKNIRCNVSFYSEEQAHILVSSDVNDCNMSKHFRLYLDDRYKDCSYLDYPTFNKVVNQLQEIIDQQKPKKRFGLLSKLLQYCNMKQEYYTENRKRVTEYVENNLTLFFTELNEAIKTSLSFKTYHYEMFNEKMEFIGYGVPRNQNKTIKKSKQSVA